MDVLCIGHAVWDISVFVDGYPAENSKCEIRTMLECGGGPAANAAYLLSRWGVSCGIAAVIGNDAYGDRIAEEFKGVGVDVAFLARTLEPTPVSVILVNQRNGSRTVINRKPVRRGSPLELSPLSSEKPAPQVLLFDGHELDASLHAMEMFPEARTILDAGSLRDGTRELAKRVDFLVSSERFACQFTELPDLKSRENQARAMTALRTYNGRPVVITRGEHGLLYDAGDHIEQMPAFAVQAVDTTGAGDIFHGAFAYGVLKGLSIEETLRLASAAAALSVTVQGSRTSVPTLSQTQAFLGRQR